MNTLNTPSSITTRTARLSRLAAVALLLGGTTVAALAQYKIVGPDGKVTYTDKPPTAQDIKMPSGNGASTGGTPGVPYETRQAMAKYPVTLYAGRNCPPCDQARQALRQRGVPFNEYSVSSNADIAALQSRFGGTTMPVISVGGQSMKGYSPNDLAGYLDAAGYPAQARLVGYNWPAAVPLAPPGAPVAADAGDATPAATPTPAPLLPPPSKSGIQF
jgi:glutaredoxin